MPVTNYYTVQGEIIGERTVGQSRLDYIPDALGSVVATVDQTLTVKITARYKPYGADLATTGTTTKLGWFGEFGFRTQPSPHSNISASAWTYSTLDGTWTTPVELWPRRRPYVLGSGKPTRRPHPVQLKPSPLSPVNGAGISGGFNYGAYCGPSVQQNPAWNVKPQDCIDACCKVHDRCLEAQYGAGFSEGQAHSCCDAGLANCVSAKLKLGCCPESPTPWGCRYAGETIGAVFDILGNFVYSKWLYQCNCVPASLYEHYSTINWGSPCAIHPLKRSVWSSVYNCSSAPVSGTAGPPARSGEPGTVWGPGTHPTYG